jgi:hypothetical protein
LPGSAWPGCWGMAGGAGGRPAPRRSSPPRTTERAVPRRTVPPVLSACATAPPGPRTPMQQIVQAYRERAGIAPPVHPHLLRH